MDKEEAIAVFVQLEQLRHPSEVGNDEGECPVFKVRLDAGDNGDYGRDYRVRVSEADGLRAEPRSWREVLTVADESECWVQVQNNGIELS